MQFYPTVDPEDFSFKRTEIPQAYLEKKPKNFLKHLNFDSFIQLLEEAAGKDDIAAIWKIWTSTSAPLESFPGILLAICEIIDEEGFNGSAYYTLGVIITRNSKHVVIFAEGFDPHHYEGLEALEKTEKVDFEYALKAFRERCGFEKSWVSGLKAEYKVFIDKRRKLFKEL